MWLQPMNGETNFVYFQCLACNVIVAILLLGFCAASLRRDKALRITLKQIQSQQTTTTEPPEMIQQ
jgi:hypothetical protein